MIIFCFLYNFIPKNGITFNYVFCKSLLRRGVPSNIYVWVNIIMKYFLSIMCELYWIKSCQSRSFSFKLFWFYLAPWCYSKNLKMKKEIGPIKIILNYVFVEAWYLFLSMTQYIRNSSDYGHFINKHAYDTKDI